MALPVTCFPIIFGQQSQLLTATENRHNDNVSGPSHSQGRRRGKQRSKCWNFSLKWTLIIPCSVCSKPHNWIFFILIDFCNLSTSQFTSKQVSSFYGFMYFSMQMALKKMPTKKLTVPWAVNEFWSYAIGESRKEVVILTKPCSKLPELV